MLIILDIVLQEISHPVLIHDWPKNIHTFLIVTSLIWPRSPSLFIESIYVSLSIGKLFHRYFAYVSFMSGSTECFGYSSNIATHPTHPTSRRPDQTKGAHGSQPGRKSWTFQTVKGSPKSESKTLKSRGFTQKQNANTVRPGKDLRNDLSIVQVISITPWKKITTKTPSTSRHRATQRNSPFEIAYIKILLAWLRGHFTAHPQDCHVSEAIP